MYLILVKKMILFVVMFYLLGGRNVLLKMLKNIK